MAIGALRYAGVGASSLAERSDKRVCRFHFFDQTSGLIPELFCVPTLWVFSMYNTSVLPEMVPRVKPIIRRD